MAAAGERTMIRLIESSSAQLRLQEARAFVATHAARGDVWLVGASRGAVDDLARGIAAQAGGPVRPHRFSPTPLAPPPAGPVLAGPGLAALPLSRPRGGGAPAAL